MQTIRFNFARARGLWTDADCVESRRGFRYSRYADTSDTENGFVLPEDRPMGFVRTGLRLAGKEPVQIVERPAGECVVLKPEHQPVGPLRVGERAGAAFVKTSTGFGMVKGESGGLQATGATEHDVRLMRKHCGPTVQVKASMFGTTFS